MIRSVPTGYLSDLIKTALTARVEIVGGSEPNAKGILDKIELAISEDTSEAELEFVAATPGMLGEYKKALPLWQRLPVSYSCESEGILHTVPRDESMTRDDGMVQYGFAPGEEPRVYTA